MIQELIRKEIGLNGIVHTYISHFEIPDELVKPKKRNKNKVEE